MSAIKRYVTATAGSHHGRVTAFARPMIRLTSTPICTRSSFMFLTVLREAGGALGIRGYFIPIDEGFSTTGEVTAGAIRKS